MVETLLQSDLSINDPLLFYDLHKRTVHPVKIAQSRVYSPTLLSSFVTSKVREGLISPDVVSILTLIPFIRGKRTQEELLATMMVFLRGREYKYDEKVLAIVNELRERKKIRYHRFFNDFITYYLNEPYTPRSKFFSDYINYGKGISYALVSNLKKQFFNKFLTEDILLTEEGKKLRYSEKFVQYVFACEYLWRRSRKFIRNQIYLSKTPVKKVASKFNIPAKLVKEVVDAFFFEIFSDDYEEGDLLSVGNFKMSIRKKSEFSLHIKINRRW